MNALILSAGFGTRFRPHTEKLAKAALPLLNLPMLAYPLYYLEMLGLDRLVINLHHLPDTVIKSESRLALNKNYELVFLHETPQILDSGGGVSNAFCHLVGRGDFAVANADSVMFFNHHDSLKPLVDKHKQRNAIATILTCDKDGVGTQFGGVLVDDTGHVLGFSKTPSPQYRSVHYAGHIIFSEKISKYLKDGTSNILYDVITNAINDGETVIHHHEDHASWFETGDLQSYLESTKKMLSHLAEAEDSIFRRNLVSLLQYYRPHWRFERQPGFIWGASQMVPSVMTPVTQILIGDNVKIGSNTKMDGFCVIGDNVTIPDGASVTNSVLANNTQAPQILSNQLLL